jgi:hypothetical protein
VEFLLGTMFWCVTFAQGAFFDGATFSSLANFARAAFYGSASFSGATFEDFANFAGVTIYGGAMFNDTKFMDSATFASATIKFLTTFAGATFKKARLQSSSKQSSTRGPSGARSTGRQNLKTKTKPGASSTLMRV